MLVRVVSVATICAACTYLTAGSATSVQAESPTPGIITSDATPANLTRLNDLPIPGNGVLVADLNIHTTTSVSFDTLADLGQYCRNAFLYRVTDKGDLIAHPFTCDGNRLQFAGTGGDQTDTGDYDIAIFPSSTAVSDAPQSVAQNPDTQALNVHYLP